MSVALKKLGLLIGGLTLASALLVGVVVFAYMGGTRMADAHGPVTVDTYDSVQVGMSYDQVRDLVGWEGVQDNGLHYNSPNGAVYAWHNIDRAGSWMRVTFRDGKVVRKSQDRLQD